MNALTQACKDFPAHHAYRHRLTGGGRESLAHMLMFPQLGIAGFIYPTVLADGFAKGRASLFGPGLAAPIHEQVEGPVAESLDFGDWSTGPLRMCVRSPHRSVDLSWSGAQIRFDGHFEALHPPYPFSLHPDGVPPYFGDNRTEQHGRLNATLAVQGQQHEISGYLVRDHSWGPRIWGLNQHYKWFHAITDTCSIHFFEMESFGRRAMRGYLYRDGALEHLASVHCEFTYDAQMMHQAVRAEVVDAAGRRAVVTCQAFATLQLEFDPMIYLNEAALTLDIDGQPGTGWCEFCWNRYYLDFARQHVQQYG
jgi:hypothetical protein